MTDMPARFDAADETGAAAEESGDRINGVVDLPRPGRVSGWAIDRADPGAAVTVRIAREGRLVGEVRADAPRPDLERGGIGTGRYGFSLDLDPPPEPGFEFTITATAVAADGTAGPLRRIGRAATAEDPLRRLAERSFEEIARLRAATAGPAPEEGAPIREALDRIEVVQARIEVVQARIETALASVEPPAASSTRSLAFAVGVALLVGTLSLGLGLWSMLLP